MSQQSLNQQLIAELLDNYQQLSTTSYQQHLQQSLTAIEASVLQEIIAYKIAYLSDNLTSWLGQIKAADPTSFKPAGVFTQQFAEDRSKQVIRILECKKASPSQGLINHSFSLPEIAQSYDKFASAISVLTDQKYFSGSFDNLLIVAQHTNKPLLCKDFIIDELQIVYALIHKASAVLLMFQVLNDQAIVRLANFARSLGLELLFEIHNQQELQRLIKLKDLIEFKVVGINNRNLKSMQVDINNSQQLGIALRNALPNAWLISESGIKSYSAVTKLGQQFDGFLVGTSLMSQANLDLALTRLFAPTLKICGNLDLEVYQEQDLTSVGYLGFIAVDKSPRYIGQQLATKLQQLQDFKLAHQPTPVLVVANQAITEVLALLVDNQLTIVQLHANESVAYRQQLKASYYQATNQELIIWQAIFIAPQVDNLHNISKALQDPTIDKLLLEPLSDSALTGGNGKSFAWQILNQLTINELERIIIAGGLDLEQSPTAWQYGAAIYDYNSKLETKPGYKSRQLLQQLFTLVNPKYKSL